MSAKEQRRVTNICNLLKKYHSEVLKLLTTSEENYEKVRKQIISKEINIPLCPKKNLHDYFQLQKKRNTKMSVEQLDEYLKKLIRKNEFQEDGHSVEINFEKIYNHLVELNSVINEEKESYFTQAQDLDIF
ncbi:hypothetical protein ABEB36_006056 [Hypothenemus hampei]|uniref:Uncharacterized protein n=1 Tax=Hypothenemus hampei TaxID=57062 RepID=A0ABD1E1P1_HYPHA